MGCREGPSGGRLLLVRRNSCVDTASLIKQNSVNKLFLSVTCRNRTYSFPESLGRYDVEASARHYLGTLPDAAPNFRNRRLEGRAAQGTHVISYPIEVLWRMWAF